MWTIENRHRYDRDRLRYPSDLTDAESEFGSSEYAKEILGAVWGFPPSLELKHEAQLQKAVVQMIDVGLLDSAHDCSDGGIAAALPVLVPSAPGKVAKRLSKLRFS